MEEKEDQEQGDETEHQQVQLSKCAEAEYVMNISCVVLHTQQNLTIKNI